MIDTQAGVHAASAGGIVADMPSACTTSDMKYMIKQNRTLPTIAKLAPVRRFTRSVKLAAIKTMAHNKNG